MVDLKPIVDTVIAGNAPETKRLVEQAVAEGIDAKRILAEALIPAMGEVGQRMKTGKFFVPEVLVAARAMHWGLDVLKPQLAVSSDEPLGRVVIGTVKGDLHDIGKNLAAMLLEGNGFEVIDLGVDVSTARFVTAVEEKHANLLGLSALLTTTMPNMKATIDALKEAGLREKVKVLIGGAPLTQQYADEIGADGYARDAASGVEKAKEILGLGVPA